MARPEWQVNKLAYQSGESVRGIAARFCVSHTAINKGPEKRIGKKFPVGFQFLKKFPLETRMESTADLQRQALYQHFHKR